MNDSSTRAQIFETQILAWKFNESGSPIHSLGNCVFGTQFLKKEILRYSMPTATDQQLEQLKQKYQSVFNMIQQQQIRLAHVNMQDNKLFVQGDAPSEDAKSRVWDQIKLVNPNWQSELTADIRVQASNRQAAQSGRAPRNGPTP